MGPARRRRRWHVQLAKLIVGVGILLVILGNVSFDDSVVYTADGREETLEGRDLQVRGTLEGQGPDGPLSIPLTDSPQIQQQGADWRVRLRGKDWMAVGEPHYLGEATLKVDGEPRTIPLAQVHLKRGIEEDGWREMVLDTKEGLVTIFGRLTLGWYALAMALILGMYVSGILRWKILLAAQEIRIPFLEAARLTFIGFFFNSVVPGLTGGDVVKAVMIARAHRGRGARAVGTVIVDRIIGLLVLAGLSAIVLAFTWEQYKTQAIAVFLFIAGAGIVIALFLSRRVRRLLRIDRLLRRLPGSSTLRALDESFLLYRSKPGAIAVCTLLSVASHAFNIVAIFIMGMDLGVSPAGGLEGTPIVTYAATVPIILIASSVPLLPGGWGFGEFMYAVFFRTVGVWNIDLSIALSILTRASMLLWSLPGGIFLLVDRREARAAIEEAEAGVEVTGAIAAPREES